MVGTLSNIGQAVLPGGKEAINVGDLGGSQFPQLRTGNIIREKKKGGR